jgi:hypothetical protein
VELYLFLPLCLAFRVYYKQNCMLLFNYAFIVVEVLIHEAKAGV